MTINHHRLFQLGVIQKKTTCSEDRPFCTASLPPWPAWEAFTPEMLWVLNSVPLLQTSAWLLLAPYSWSPPLLSHLFLLLTPAPGKCGSSQELRGPCSVAHSSLSSPCLLSAMTVSICHLSSWPSPGIRTQPPAPLTSHFMPEGSSATGGAIRPWQLNFNSLGLNFLICKIRYWTRFCQDPLSSLTISLVLWHIYSEVQ